MGREDVFIKQKKGYDKRLMKHKAKIKREFPNIFEIWQLTNKVNRK